MENKELNLAKILYDHIGKKFYSDVFGQVTLTAVNKDKITILWGRTHVLIFPDGSMQEGERCVIFPSRDQRDWAKWAEENKKVTYVDVKNSFGDAIFKVNDYLICSSLSQHHKLSAINKLMNVQKFLEKGWQPDWNDKLNVCRYIYINTHTNKIKIGVSCNQCGDIYFSTEANAQKAIDILGEETIRTALSTDW